MTTIWQRLYRGQLVSPEQLRRKPPTWPWFVGMLLPYLMLAAGPVAFLTQGGIGFGMLGLTSIGMVFPLLWGEHLLLARHVDYPLRHACPPCQALGRNAKVLIPAIACSCLAAALAAVAYGSWATEARVWDGFALWELRAKQLGPTSIAPTSLGAALGDPGVVLPGRPYPLLHARLANLLFVLFGGNAERFLSFVIFVGWLLFLAGYSSMIRLGATRAWLLIGAFGLTPMLYSVGSAGIDSGYAEVLMGFVLTLAAAGLVLRRARLLFVATALLVWSKPEGTPYACLLLLITCFFDGGRRLHYLASAGLFFGLVTWLPLRAQLTAAESSGAWLAFLVLPAAILCKELQLRWRLLRTHWRWLLPCALLVFFGTLVLLRESLGSGSSVVLRDFVPPPERLWARLTDAPRIAIGVAEGLFLDVKKHGLVFAVLFVSLLVPGFRRWRSRPRTALAFVLGGLVLCVFAIVLGPEDDLSHEFRSRFDRLLLHWVGPAWVVLAPWLARIFGARTRAELSPEAAPEGRA